MTINNATVEQINVALLDIDKRIKALNADSETLKSLQNSVKTIKSSLNETQAGLTSGATYDINISGNAATATKATTAEEAKVADTATNANISKTLDTVNGDKLQIGSGTAQNITNAKHAATATKAETATKAVEVVDYGNTSRTVKIGFSGPGLTAKNLSHLAGYTDGGSNSVKLKDVNREELLKWLGIAVAIKYADYRTEELSFSSSTDQKKIELSDFGPGITEENVINFMVIYWTGVPIIASGDWAKSQGLGTKGLGCALHTLNPNGGTGRCVVRCVYTTSIVN